MIGLVNAYHVVYLTWGGFGIWPSYPNDL